MANQQLMHIKNGAWGFHEPRKTKDDKVIIAVHPYYLHNTHDIDYYASRFYRLSGPPDSPAIKKLMQYEENLIEILREHKGPLITFEEMFNYENTAERYQHFGRTENTFFFLTNNGGTLLKHYSLLPQKKQWNLAFEFINQFNTEKWDFIGGYYNKKDKYSGCLGGVLEKIEQQKDPEKHKQLQLNVLEDITFSFDDTF